MCQSLADDEIVSDELRTRIAMKYVWVARKVRPPRSYKLLWGRMRFGAHRRGKGGKQWLKRFSECWTRCKLCRDKIKPLDFFQTVCAFFVHIFLLEGCLVVTWRRHQFYHFGIQIHPKNLIMLRALSQFDGIKIASLHALSNWVVVLVQHHFWNRSCCSVRWHFFFSAMQPSPEQQR